ncbi:MAG: zinc-binding dehydrogenase [Thaumarchaeota archaeon]|nr:zinc-binding dehydrogenase [Nitrososphaerota archaeon]
MTAQGSASVFAAPKRPLAIQRFPLPEKIEDEAALLRVTAAGVCGTDVHLWHGRLKIPVPVILGHETVGEVATLGSRLNRDLLGNPLAVGDRVVFASGVSCGRCYYCAIAQEPTRCLRRKVYGINLTCSQPPHFFGGQAEYVYLIPGVCIFKLPDGLPTDAIVAVGCAAPTTVHAFENAGGMHHGENVVIQGAGPVGLFSLVLALEGGASKVIVLDQVQSRLEAAKKMGADHVLNISDFENSEQRVAKVHELTNGIGADMVVECSGNPKAVQEGWLMCRDSGRYLEVGHYTDRGEAPLNPHIITRKQLKITGSWGMAPRHYLHALRVIEKVWSKYGLNQLVGRKFPLEDSTQALEAVEKGEVVKAVITP